MIEPLRELFKDEVRAAGESMGMPHDVLWRHPFPGPGLAVRCLGDLTDERLATLREADAIVDDRLIEKNFVLSNELDSFSFYKRWDFKNYLIQ